jgi:hypothetical protein
VHIGLAEGSTAGEKGQVQSQKELKIWEHASTLEFAFAMASYNFEALHLALGEFFLGSATT